MTKTHIKWSALGAVLVALVALGAFIIHSTISASAAEYVHESDVMGYVDVVQFHAASTIPPGLRVKGWAFERGSGSYGTEIQVKDENGTVIDSVRTGDERQDVYEVYGSVGASPYTGFIWYSPPRYNDGADHTFSFWAKSFKLEDTYQYIGEAYMSPFDAGVAGSLDGIIDNSVIGWAVDLDDNLLYMSHIPVAVYIDGDFIAANTAHLERPDVENALIDGFPQVGSFHGYNIPISKSHIPEDLRDGQRHRIEVFALEVTEGVMTSVGVDWNFITPAGLIVDSEGTVEEESLQYQSCYIDSGDQVIHIIACDEEACYTVVITTDGSVDTIGMNGVYENGAEYTLSGCEEITEDEAEELAIGDVDAAAAMLIE